jgi:hypothetical protein
VRASRLATPPKEGAAHAERCAPVQYASKPPSSGTHTTHLAVFRAYDKPVPWGYLVHCPRARAPW